MEEAWYTRGARTQKEKGPFATSALLRAMHDGDLHPSTLVRGEHEQTWTALREHPSFRPQPSPPTDEQQAADAALERAIELGSGKPSPVPATPPWWIGASVGFGVLVVLRIEQRAKIANGAEDAGYVIGTIFGTFLSVMIVVGIASLWRGNRTQYGRVKWFCIGSFLILALNLLTVLAVGLVSAYRQLH